MITLYGFEISAHCKKVRVLLEELRLSHEYQEVSYVGGEHKTPAFLAKNPLGKVPVLQDEDLVLSESGAILWYLGNQYGRGQVVPGDAKDIARVDQWMFWIAADAHGVIAKPWYLHFFARVGQPFKPEDMIAAVQAARGPLSHIDRSLQGRDFLVANQLTIADVMTYAAVAQAVEAGVDLSEHPHLKRWYDALSLRPAFSTVYGLPPPAAA